MRRVRKQAQKEQTSQPPLPLDDGTVTTPGSAVTLAMIQALIRLGRRIVEEALQAEVITLAGNRYAHRNAHPDLVPWGATGFDLPGRSVPAGDRAARAQPQSARRELPLASYPAFQAPRAQDTELFRRRSDRLSCPGA